MGQSVPFTQVSDGDIARALAEVPLDGWPADEDDLVQLFGRMLSALAGPAACEATPVREHMLLLLPVGRTT